MVVLKKVKHPDEESGCKVELQVVGVIRHKILFKNRPKALISSKISLSFRSIKPTLEYIFRFVEDSCEATYDP